MTTKVGEAIVATGRFVVPERQQLKALVGEQALAKGGVITTDTPGKIGGFEGADYVIYGTVGQISTRPVSDFGSSLLASLSTGGNSQNCSQILVTMPLSLRITDSSSAIVKYQSRIESYWRSGLVCNGQQPGIDTNALMTDAANKAASALVTAIYPMQVAAVQADGLIVLNYGEGTVKMDEMLVIYQSGEEIVDPTTGEVLGANETKLGLIKVTEVLPRISRAKPVTALASAIPTGAVVRSATAAEIKEFKSRKKDKK